MTAGVSYKHSHQGEENNDNTTTCADKAFWLEEVQEQVSCKLHLISRHA